MNLPDIIQSVDAKLLPRSQGSGKSRGDTWNSCKDEIYRVYMTEKSTLSDTMELFERNYGLKACTRTWKAKLKEWKFEKYVTDKENGMRVVTAEKRGREANKTAVPHGKRPISPGQMAPFKKRKDEKGTEVMPQKSATPPELTHNTPSLAEGNDPVCEFHAHRAFRQLKTLDGSFQNSNTSLVNSITSAGLNGAYSASLRMFKTVKNDSTLFLAAMAAGLVRILVRNLEEELKGEIKIRNLGGKYNFLWWTGGTSGTDVWCDTCLKLLGAKVSYDCHVCPELVERCWYISHCSDCYDNKRTLCQAQNHYLVPDESSISATCRIAAEPDDPRICDAVDCDKDISGLYFRELPVGSS